MPAALRGLSHARRRDDLAAEFIRAAHVHEVRFGSLRYVHDLRQHRAQFEVRLGDLVLGRRDLRRVRRQRFVFFIEPFHAAAVHEANVFVAVNFEQPEAISREPVVVIAVKNDGILGRNAGAAHQLFKLFFADDVAPDLILQLRLPIETDCAGNVAGVISFGVHVNFNEVDARLVKVVLDPIG